MAETRWRFDQDFREGAVRIVRESGKPIAHVAKGPRHQQRHTGELDRPGSAVPGRRPALTEDKRTELVRLRRETRSWYWSVMCSKSGPLDLETHSFGADSHVL